MTASNDPTGDDQLDNDRPAERVSALAKLYEGESQPDPDEITGPTFWPDLSPGEPRQEWAELCVWVEQLIERFSHLDHHVIPGCWYRHNGHVEALAALRDQERVNYAETAPGTAGVDWHRAFQTVEARLRDWTGQLACGATHEPRTRRTEGPDPHEWEQFVTDDITRREHRAIDVALAEEER